MLYKFNKNTLIYTKVSWLNIILKPFILVIALSILLNWSFKSDKILAESEVLILTAEQYRFTEDKCIKMIDNMNFKFPYIVYAQAILESNSFSSNIFNENNNLFGMKEAVIRINTAIGTNNEHAYYHTWIESVYDYALYYATYLSSLKTEDEYYSYLSQFYAEDKEYVNKVKYIIQERQLVSLFK